MALWVKNKTNDIEFGHRELKNSLPKISGEGKMSNQIDTSVFIPAAQHQYMQYYSPQIPPHMMQTQYHEVSCNKKNIVLVKWVMEKVSLSRNDTVKSEVFYIILVIYNRPNTQRDIFCFFVMCRRRINHNYELSFLSLINWAPYGYVRKRDRLTYTCPFFGVCVWLDHNYKFWYHRH